MNQILASSIILALSLVLWGLGKRSGIQILRKSYATDLNSSNNAQIGLVEPSKGSTKPIERNISFSVKDWESPSSPRERLRLQTKLSKSMTEGPEERLEAISIAAYWGHRCVLPLLRKGLRDFDGRIVEIAAKALNNHKYYPLKNDIQIERPPRNVALMR